MPQDKRKVYESDDDKFASKKLKSSNNMFSRIFNLAILCDSSFYSRRSKDSDSSNFSQKKCIALFNEYASKDDKNIIGPHGIHRFCNDINVHIEDPVMLVIAWKMECKQMGIFTLKEWLKGFSELQCDSLTRIKGKIDYLRQLLLDYTSFKSIYRFSFGFSKEPNQKVLDINTAKALLKILLADINQWELFEHFIEFLNQSNYQFINLDQWCNVLEFSKTINNQLVNYSEEGAWPIMIDEFCCWYKLKILDQHI